MAKETITKMKKEPTVWENIFASDTSDKGLIFKIYTMQQKELLAFATAWMELENIMLREISQ